MTQHVIRRIEGWFLEHCDGDWEHESGIRIATLDNPGWSMTVQLDGTELADAPFTAVDINRGESDWIRCKVTDGTFKGWGGPSNLMEILATFLDWSEAQSLVEPAE